MTTRERAREHRVHRRRTSGPPGRRGCAGAALSLRGSPGYGPLSDVPSRVLRSNAASATHQGFPARAARSLPATHQLVRHLLSTPQPSMQLPSAHRPTIGRPTAGPTTAPSNGPTTGQTQACSSDPPPRWRLPADAGGGPAPEHAARSHRPPTCRRPPRTGGSTSERDRPPTPPRSPHRSDLSPRVRNYARVRLLQRRSAGVSSELAGLLIGVGWVARRSWLGCSSELAGLLVRVDGASHQQPGPVASG